MEYNDPLLRPTKITAPNGQQTITEYGAGTSEATRWVKVRTQIDGTNWKEAISWFDGLGRNVVSQSVDNDQDDIFVATCYDEMGRVAKTSNPVRASSAPTCSSSLEWTTPAYDDLGRTVSVTTPDSAVVTTAYSLATSGSQIGTTVTVTDQAGKLRRSITNALGQLTRVDEPNDAGQLGSISSPNQATYYTYNTNGKIVRVNQGVQDRYFMYDSLGRLLRIRQPEQEVNTALNTSGNPNNNSWTAGFTYDANGNILTTTDANNVTITSTYDALNRQVTRSYTDSTPAVTYTYDDQQVANSKGRLTKIYSTVSETRYTEYNEIGKIKSSEQRTDGEVYPSEYTYNLAGMLVEQTYPSGRVVQNAMDGNGDLAHISSRVVNGMFKNYASNFEYTASGVIKHLQIGNGLWESAELNSRDQVTELKMGTSVTDGSLMHLNYEYGDFDTNGDVDPTKNSGNIAKQTITVSGMANPFVQKYQYDTLDRITEAKEVVNGGQTWIQQFGYDRYGNRTSLSETVQGQSKPINEVTLPSVDANTNRFSSGTDYEYDAVGNLIRDAHGRQFTFNGDNKQTLVKDQSDTTVGEYFYDGNGKRVKKVTASEYVIFVYDAAGKLIAELSTDPPSNPTVNYTATDPLGSPRVITNKQGEVISRRDFMPFGEEVVADATYRTASNKYGVGDNVRQKFTGYERDEETGLDFAEARYYYNDHGRFTAVDPLLASGKSADPQTFNRYAYTMNRPLILTDKTGLQSGQKTETKAQVVVPKKVLKLATEPVVQDNGRTIFVTPAFIQLKRDLINVVYPAQSEIARQNAANIFAGGPENPTRSITSIGEVEKKTVTNTKGGHAGIDLGTDGASAEYNDGGENSQENSTTNTGSTTVENDLSNTTEQSKEIYKTTSLLIQNFLNTEGNQNGDIEMPVEGAGDMIEDGTFSREDTKRYFEKFVNTVRNIATCDVDSTACGGKP